MTLRRQSIILLAIVITGVLLRLHGISQASLWADELWSIEMAMGHGSVHDAFPDGVIRFDQPIPTDPAQAAPWWSIWTHVQGITHPPLYYMLLRVWMDALGNTPGATRGLSVLFSAAAIVVMFDVCRLLHGPVAGLIAAAIFALALGQIELAQEARSYSLIMLEELAACDLTARIMLSGASGTRLVALVMLLSIMFLTHYLSAGVIASLAIFAAIRLRGRGRQRTLVAFACAMILVAAVWGVQFRQQLRTIPFSDPTYFHEISPNHLTSGLSALAALPLQFLLGEEFGSRAPAWADAAVWAGIIALLARTIWRPDRLLWSILFITIIGGTALLDLARGTDLLRYSRYTVFAAPALFAMLAALRWPANLPIIPMTVAFALLCTAIAQALQPVAPRQDFRQLATLIDTRTSPHELLVFFNESDWLSPGMWYMGYKYYSPQSDHPWLALRRPPDRKLLAKLNDWPALWLIGRTPERFGPIIFPGWRPIRVWHTSAGGMCLMGNPNHQD